MFGIGWTGFVLAFYLVAIVTLVAKPFWQMHRLMSEGANRVRQRASDDTVVWLRDEQSSFSPAELLAARQLADLETADWPVPLGPLVLGMAALGLPPASLIVNAVQAAGAF